MHSGCHRAGVVNVCPRFSESFCHRPRPLHHLPPPPPREKVNLATPGHDMLGHIPFPKYCTWNAVYLRTVPQSFRNPAFYGRLFAHRIAAANVIIVCLCMGQCYYCLSVHGPMLLLSVYGWASLKCFENDKCCGMQTFLPFLGASVSVYVRNCRY